MSGDVSSAVAIRKRNRSIRELAKSALESIPMIPIHVTEIKKLILKDNQGSSNLKERHGSFLSPSLFGIPPFGLTGIFVC
jgi:hypothetical protein